jgi:hypothetical protein
MRYDCLKGQKRNELAMLLEREYIRVDPPLDVVLEVGVPVETGVDAELARVRAPHRESRNGDNDPPRYAPASPCFMAFSSSRVAAFCADGDQRPVPQMLRTVRGDLLGLEPEDRNQWAVPRLGQHRARGGEVILRSPRPKASFGGWSG